MSETIEISGLEVSSSGLLSGSSRISSVISGVFSISSAVLGTGAISEGSTTIGSPFDSRSALRLQFSIRGSSTSNRSLKAEISAGIVWITDSMSSFSSLENEIVPSISRLSMLSIDHASSAIWEALTILPLPFRVWKPLRISASAELSWFSAQTGKWSCKFSRTSSTSSENISNISSSIRSVSGIVMLLSAEVSGSVSPIGSGVFFPVSCSSDWMAELRKDLFWYSESSSEGSVIRLSRWSWRYSMKLTTSSRWVLSSVSFEIPEAVSIIWVLESDIRVARSDMPIIFRFPAIEFRASIAKSIFSCSCWPDKNCSKKRITLFMLSAESSITTLWAVSNWKDRWSFSAVLPVFPLRPFSRKSSNVSSFSHRLMSSFSPSIEEPEAGNACVESRSDLLQSLYFKILQILENFLSRCIRGSDSNVSVLSDDSFCCSSAVLVATISSRKFVSTAFKAFLSA